jgi:hypothetical protein
MTKPKNIEESGTVLAVPKETVQRKPTTVSYTEAKKMVKKPMSEAQSAHVAKMVEANRAKWEEKRKAKEDTQKAQTEAMRKQIEEDELEEVVVLPKRVYPPRKKKVEEDLQTNVAIDVKPKKKKIIYVEESESESEEEVIVKKKPPVKKVIEKAHETAEAIKKIDSVLNNTNRYSHLLKW